MRPMYLTGLLRTRLVLTNHKHDYVIVNGERIDFEAVLDEEHSEEDTDD